ncbi:unnamed protein product, partial [Iphiclides podalirius]
MAAHPSLLHDGGIAQEYESGTRKKTPIKRDGCARERPARPSCVNTSAGARNSGYQTLAGGGMWAKDVSSTPQATPRHSSINAQFTLAPNTPIPPEL